MPELEKRTSGDQTLHYNLRGIFIPQGAQGSVCTELFPSCIPVGLSLTIGAYSPQTLPKKKVLMSYSFPIILYHSDSCMLVN